MCSFASCSRCEDSLKGRKISGSVSLLLVLEIQIMFSQEN